ncbi:Trafficking kinesin-binding protein 1 [Orchesella cincta]|uniref:Trafficking kinesin-binding protein 1 n=1 Tax=Orchesella cincta TaxID=48709 RepID=A0A1D2MGF4_ORCCI|nr:Trafficking kinesin-binding protein 1 [Orchesella cincta]
MSSLNNSLRNDYIHESLPFSLHEIMTTITSFSEDVFESETGFDFKGEFNLLTVLSGERVSQMTKTYLDADALQKLLEEKEKDLELAARIGQQLLEQNRILEEKVAVLEAENKDNVESITQLKHDLQFKTQLLELYNESDSTENSKAGTPIGTVASVLERRVATLEEENKSLRNEASRMAEDVEKTEAEERYLVQDAIDKLSETNTRLTIISDDLQRKNEEAAAQQEEIFMLAEETKLFAETNKELLEENIELRNLVDELKTCRDELSTELVDMKDNYVEVVAILKETQDQLRDAQKKKEGGADVVSVFDSLAYEIESSVARQRRASDYFRRTFDTVRLANNKIAENMAASALMSSASSSGYLSGSSGLPSLESSQDAMNFQSNAASLVLSGSDLGSSICHTPGGSTPGSWKLPEKLQIVKPLEGSSTLQVWSALATPHLGNLLEKRPGVQMRVERPVGEIGMQTLLSLTEDEHSTLQNIVSTPAVFTFVTTTTCKDRGRGPQTSPIVSSCSVDGSSSLAIMPSASGSQHSMWPCETPKNSPIEGNTRPGSPNPFSHRGEDAASSNRTMKTLYSFYDSLCSKLVGLGSPSSSSSKDYVGSPQKYDLTTKLGRVEVAFESSRIRAPVKPGTGALDKILYGMEVEKRKKDGFTD